MNVKTRVYLRADGNSQIGLGHIHRLIALGEMLKNDFDCVFLIRSPLPGIKELILKTGLSIMEIQNGVPVESEAEHLGGHFTGNEIIVLDGYSFDTAYQQNIKRKSSQLVCIDDIHEFHFACDVVINPAGGIDRSKYSCDAHTRVFTGPAYAFLKRPFLEGRKDHSVQSGNNLLICMGGADVDNNTLLTLQQSIGFGFDRITVIIGEAYPHKKLLEAFTTTSTGKIEVLTSLNPVALADVMKECGVAITSASGVAYEYLSLGGELYIQQTAANQKDLFNYLIKSKLAFPYALFRAGPEAVKVSKIEQIKIFDRNSDQRLSKIFKTVEFSLKLKIRKAEKRDLATVFEWANDPEQRSQSYNTDRISLAEHTSWFAKKIADSNCVLYIFEVEDLPVAQVRFDIKDGEAVISYSIDRNFRGKGFGHTVLSRALRQLKEDCRFPRVIVGFVKSRNVSSMKIFENIGFIKKDSTQYPDSYRYEYSK